jgi:hypothetical protein
MNNKKNDINSDILELNNAIITKLSKTDKNLLQKYIENTSDIVEQYQKLIAIPVKTSFIKSSVTSKKNDQEITLLIDNYLDITLELFSDYDIIYNLIKKNIKIANKNQSVCECGNDTDFIYKFNTYRICENCGLETDYIICTVENSTYNDLQQINLNQRYTYEKICHFKDTVNQFQAKQNKHISDKVFQDLYDMINKHDLIVKNTTDNKIKYSKVTKQHIRDFLYETNNNKYYEDIQLLWCKITENEPPNITELEKSLFEDFEKLVNAFLSIPDTNRKNFLNSQYVLKQLLRRYNYFVKDTDLNMLKTPARLREHDEIYEKCCDILNWNFQPL